MAPLPVLHGTWYMCVTSCVLHDTSVLLQCMWCAQAVSYIWPSGKKSYTPASADRALVKGKVPYFLAQAWNK